MLVIVAVAPHPTWKRSVSAAAAAAAATPCRIAKL